MQKAWEDFANLLIAGSKDGGWGKMRLITLHYFYDCADLQDKMSCSRNLERITGLLCHALLLVSHSSWVKGKKLSFTITFLCRKKSHLSILLPWIRQLTFWRGNSDKSLLQLWSPPASSAASGKE